MFHARHDQLGFGVVFLCLSLYVGFIVGEGGCGTEPFNGGFIVCFFHFSAMMFGKKIHPLRGACFIHKGILMFIGLVELRGRPCGLESIVAYAFSLEEGGKPR